MKYLIQGGHVVDPANRIDAVADILIANGTIEKVAKNISCKNARTIDAKGKIVTPGLIDMHVHLREPGREDKETVRTGTRAAIAGGITSVCCMPNTDPVIDDPPKVKTLSGIIKKTAAAETFIIGAITKNIEGKTVTDMQKMKKGGIVAVSDDGNSISATAVALEALKRAKKNALTLISHCEDKKRTDRGVINEGIVATKLGLRPMPRSAEYEVVERNIALAKKTGGHLHIAHISCRESVALLRKAKKQGLKVTGEVTPHHCTLTDECCGTYDTNTKVNPPLRSKEDVAAIHEGLADGTIDAIASDHAPHGKHEKDVPFDFAAFGIIGLETSLALSLCLVEKKIISWKRLVELMSYNPATILGLKRKGRLSPGCDADVTIIDPEARWTYTGDSVQSKSRNSPFLNWHLKGKAVGVILGGKVVLEHGKIHSNQ
jgi:dihydroorotase